MKIYNVVYEYGQYSDKSWTLMGSFSSEKLAEDFITEQTTPPSKESTVKEYEAYKARTLSETQEFLQSEINSLELLKKQRDALLKKAQENPNSQNYKNAEEFGKHSFSHKERNIESSKKRIESDNYCSRFDVWFNLHFRRPSRDCFSVIEFELDNPPEGDVEDVY